MVRSTLAAERLEPALPEAPDAPARSGAPIWAKAFVGLGVLLVVISTGSYATTKFVRTAVDEGVNRGNLLGDSVQPAVAKEKAAKVEGPMTFLIMGSDSRGADNLAKKNNFGNVPQGERSDTIIVGHVPRSMDRAFLISIPRDSYVPIANVQGDGFGGKDKINSAFTPGGAEGAQRLVKTVNGMTGSKIDYPVIVDFSAVRTITDLVGGVDVVVDKESIDGYRYLQDKKYPTTPCRDASTGKRHNCLTFKKGPLHLDGQLAEYYVRQRYGLQRGDLDRAKRQQQFMRALMTKVGSDGTLTNPAMLIALVGAAAQALTVDKSMRVMNLAFALRGLRSSDLTFLTIPVIDTATLPGVGSVVRPDMARTREMFAALNAGTLDEWIIRNEAANDVSHGL